MQSQFQQEQNETERRYRPETVQKAAALAARLQEEQRGTLSQAEVDEMAAEIGIDPKLMRRALDAVAQAETVSVTPPRTRRSPAPVVIAFASSGFFLFFFISLIGIRRAAYVPSSPAIVMTPPAEAGTLPLEPLIQNGDFEAGAASTVTAQKLARGTHSLPGWTVDGGEVVRLSTGAAPGGHAIQFGESGRIQQIIPTTPNRLYRVSLTLSGQPGEIRRFHRVLVQAGDTSTTPSVLTEAGARGAGTWVHQTFEFQAENAATLLTLSPGPIDELGSGVPIIDNVSVEPLGYSH